MKQKSDIQRLLLVLLGAFVMALNIRIFVRAGDMFPGGFNGLTLLIQRTASQYLHIELPFSLINLLLNAAPAVISFLYIGKKFTLYSGLMIVVSSILTDLLPGFEITSDPLLISIFGGIINGCAISLCLFANATSGGTDFIAIFFSERKGIDTWNYISWEMWPCSLWPACSLAGISPCIRLSSSLPAPRFSTCSISAIRNRPC